VAHHDVGNIMLGYGRNIFLFATSQACFGFTYLVWSVYQTDSASVAISTSHSFVVLAFALCFLFTSQTLSYIGNVSFVSNELGLFANQFISSTQADVGLTISKSTPL
jgi:hypothetical protein